MGFQEELEKARQAKVQRELQEQQEKQRLILEREQQLAAEEAAKQVRIAYIRSSAGYKAAWEIAHNSLLLEALNEYLQGASIVYYEYFELERSNLPFKLGWKLGDHLHEGPEDALSRVEIFADKSIKLYFWYHYWDDYASGWSQQSILLHTVDEFVRFIATAIAEGNSMALQLFYDLAKVKPKINVTTETPKKKKFLGIF